MALLHFSRLYTIQQEWVVATFPQFHLYIHKLGCDSLRRSHAQKCMVMLKDGAVVLFLDARELNVNDRFLFCGYILSHILLHLCKRWEDNVVKRSGITSSKKKKLTLRELTRRSMKGEIFLWSASTCSRLAMLPKFWSNSSMDRKRDGSMKFRRVQSSWVLFWRGVPVIRTLLWYP